MTPAGGHIARRGDGRSPPLTGAALGLVALALLAGAWACLTRGPWYDEFWSLWLADSQVPLAQAIRERWLKDPNPPLFVALFYGLDPFLPRGIEGRRLVNLAALVPLAVYAWLLWRRLPQLRGFVLLFAVFSASSYYAVTALPEHRSYFFQFCLASLVFLSLAALEGAARGSLARLSLAVLGVATVLLVNLHTIVGLQILAFLGVWWLFLLVERRWALSAALAGIALVALASAGLVMLAQWDLLQALSRDFWVEPLSWPDTAGRLLGAVFQGAGSNLVAILLVLVAVAARRFAATRTVREAAMLRALAQPEPDAQAARSLLLKQGLGLMAVVAALLLLNARTPILIERYLVVLGVGSAAFLALAGRTVLTSSPAVMALVLVNTLAAGGHLSWQMVTEGRWRTSTAMVAGEVAACPGTVVIGYVFPEQRLQPIRSMQDDRVRDGLAYMAGQAGIPLRVAAGGDLPVPGACPVVVWSEHVRHALPERDVTAVEALAIMGFRLDPAWSGPARVRRTTTGIVVVLGPRRASAD